MRFNILCNFYKIFKENYHYENQFLHAHKIEFKNVSFSYCNQKNVLDNVSFTINSGEKVALLGVNGAGKSTIFNLILRFYKPISGKILIDDIDINEININIYRDFISIINQDIYLFNDTVKENIVLNKKDIDNDALEKNIKLSRLNDFVNKVGLDYMIDSNGANLSGGQRQKIAIARALIRQTKIVLLDETLSNLDLESSEEIYRLLDTNLNKDTIIVIAHDFRVLKHVDKVILIEDGKVKACGSHEDLLSVDKDYKEFICNHYIN